MSKSDLPPLHLCLDVDGVLTTGGFYYTEDGKVMKLFGPDDHDALLLLKPYLSVRCITGDRKGFAISRRRIVDDMKLELDLVSTHERVAWIAENLGLDRTIYMGDGIFDAMVFDKIFYAIAPANAFPPTRARADFVTQCSGGDRAVAEAAMHILEKFFPAHQSIFTAPSGGEWGV